jgi:tetratricopeptide (TPR) repeat protein
LAALAPTNSTYLWKLAQLDEWTGAPQDAFDLYLKLARQNDAGALKRLIALNPGLYRDEDILGILRQLAPAAQLEYALVVARMLTKQGEYDQANFFFEKHLRQTQSVEALEEYLRLLLYEYQYPKALEVLQKLARLKPDDVQVAKNLAEVYYLLGDFDSSFAVYQKLARRSDDREILQKYGTLAQCLGHYRDFSEALARQIDVSQQPDPEDFVRLAYAYGVSGAAEKRRQALEKGLHKFPDDDSLRLQLAILLAGKKDYARALVVLRDHHRLKEDLSALELYLNLLAETHDYARAEKFLNSGIDERKLEPVSIRQVVASIYEGNKNYPAAEKIYLGLCHEDRSDSANALNYARVLTKAGKINRAQAVLKPLLQNSRPDTLREAAQLYADMGKFNEAEALQKRFLQFAQQADFHDWSYLGDILSSSGNRAGASRAYQQALHVFHTTMKTRKQEYDLEGM